MSQQRFIELLENILAPDTARVKAATAELRKDYYTHPEALIQLLQILTTYDHPELRQLAATQARALVPKLWTNISETARNDARRALLANILEEKTQLVRHSTARVISAIAKIDLEDGEWMDLPGIMQSEAISSNVQHREVSTYILFTILESMADGFMDKFPQLFQLFNKTIQDPESDEVRINTMLAFSKMAMMIDTENDEQSLESFQNNFPNMVAVLQRAIELGDEDRTMQAFEVFQSLLGCDPKLLNKHFRDLIMFMITLAANKEVEDDARSQALNFLTQSVSFRKMKIQALKLGEHLTIKCLEIATEISEDSDDQDELTVARSALALLDLLAGSLPPAQVVVPLLHALGPYVNSPDPDRRRAGILALGTCVEGAPDFIATQLKEILPMILRMLEDSDLKVRQAALTTLAYISDELAEDVGKEHATIMPALQNNLLQGMKQLNGPESEKSISLVASTCNALDSILDGLEPSDVQRYISALIPPLTALFQHPDTKLKTSAIGAVGSIALNAEDAFLPFFEPIMSALSEFVQIKENEEELNLRCTTIDTMGHMALAVGAEPFQRYVRPLMEATEEGLHLDHVKLRESSYIFWSTMAKVYEEKFAPFLEGVYKGLMDSLNAEENDLEVELGEEAADLVGKQVTIAGKKITVAAAKDDGDDEEEDEDEMDDDDDEGSDWDEVTAATAVAMEKEIALEALGNIITYTKGDFMPYMEKSIETTLTLVDHSYEGTRRAAIGTLFRAFATLWNMQPEEAAKWEPGLPLKLQPSQEILKLANLIMTGTLAIWQAEEDRATVTDINRNLAETLKLTGPVLLSGDDVLSQLTNTLVSIIGKKHPCQQDFGDESDFEILEESSEYDWLLIDTAMDVLIALAGTLAEQFGELWKIYEKLVLQYASSTEHMERSTAVGTIAECVRGMGPAVTPHTTGLLKALLHRMSDEDNETKSNAAFAMGILQQYSTKSNEVLKAFPTILGKLEPMLQTKEARILDNAAGCVSRMIVKYPDHVPIKEVVPALLGLLPLKEDFEENEPVFEMIYQLYKSSDSTIINATPQVVPILAQVMGPPEGQLSESTRAELVELVTFLHTKQPALIQEHAILTAAIQ